MNVACGIKCMAEEEPVYLPKELLGWFGLNTLMIICLYKCKQVPHTVQGALVKLSPSICLKTLPRTTSVPRTIKISAVFNVCVKTSVIIHKKLAVLFGGEHFGRC